MRLMTPEEAELTALSLRPALCSEFHGGSCTYNILSHFGASFIQAVKFYFPLHFLPLVFRISQVRREPQKSLTNAFKACSRSTLMLSGMIALAKIATCIWMRSVGKTFNQGMIIFTSLIAVLATFVESQSKVSEMSLYVLPRFLDASWNFLKRRGLVLAIPGGRTMMFSLAMSVLAYCHENEPAVLRGYYQTICKHLLG